MTRHLSIAATLYLLLLAAPGAAQEESSQPANPVVSGVVQVADHIKLPAKEPGVLVHLAVKEGSLVRAGQKVGQIDDSEPQMQQKAAGYGVAAAIKKWKDDVDIRYSDAAAAVAKAAYEKMQETNQLADKAITEVDLRQAELEWHKMQFAAEKARKEQELAKFEAYTKQAELDAAKLAIDRRVITVPFDGVVEDLGRKQDEWVNPGDTILELFRLDTMHVEGAVDQSQYDPHEIQGCEVTVEVQMARGRTESFRGRITKVSAIVRGDRVYDVRAEVANRQEHGTWMLRDGVEATMTIHLGTGGTAAAGVSRAR
jgi:multidrug efflux pump subunit AcrA (membrane-fusion protein)